MAEIERFERRFAAALERYADEVPTAVDAAALTRSIADAQARRWPQSILAPWPRLAPAIRFAVALAVLVGLVVALGILAQRLVAVPADSVLSGRMTCASAAWIASAEPVTLACTLEADALGGTMTARMELEPARSLGYLDGSWSGTIRVGPDGTGWRGRVLLLVAPIGFATGDTRLTGEGPRTGRSIGLHLVSDDGLAWGVLGSEVSDR